MANSNHYETLNVNPKATQAEIKQAYRRMVKQFHPDINKETASHDRIVNLNAAYEILGDPEKRSSYDQQLQKQVVNKPKVDRPANTSTSYYRETEQFRRNPNYTTAKKQQYNNSVGKEYHQEYHHHYRHNGQDLEAHIQEWMQIVYRPVNQLLNRIFNPLEKQVEQLAADPFDDELIEAFQTYLNTCKDFLNQAQIAFHSMPNPSPFASVAAHLYYCLSQVSDGIDQLEFFTMNYDEHYLHTGQELFRIAMGLRREAQVNIREIF